MINKDLKENTSTKGTAKRSAFLKYYFTESLNGQPNPCFGNAFRSGRKVGYSETYANQILSRITKQNNPAGELLGKVRKDMVEALLDKGISADWLADLVYRLGNKTEKRVINGELIDTGEPDSHAAKTVLDFAARTQGMYDPEVSDSKFKGYSKEQLVELLLHKITKIKNTEV